MLTEEEDIVLDPFAGSNTTGAAAERLRRHWVAVDNVELYLEGSKYRFESASSDSDPSRRSYQMPLRL